MKKLIYNSKCKYNVHIYIHIYIYTYIFLHIYISTYVYIYMWPIVSTWISLLNSKFWTTALRFTRSSLLLLEPSAAKPSHGHIAKLWLDELMSLFLCAKCQGFNGYVKQPKGMLHELHDMCIRSLVVCFVKIYDMYIEIVIIYIHYMT